jgi:hypothetical protein
MGHFNKGKSMRNVLLTLPLLFLAACGDDDKDDKVTECPGDTSTQDTAADTGTTDPADTADTSGGDTADTSLPVDTGADTGADTGGDTSTPVDTGTDTGATDTGTSGDTGSGDTSSG